MRIEQTTQFLYENIGEEIKITACRSLDEAVHIPEKIEGCPVTEIGDYAFSDSGKQQESQMGMGNYSNGGEKTEQSLPYLCGKRLKEIHLPKSIRKIGRYAFYNCTMLAELSCSSNIQDLGSGFFTGCRRIRHIHIKVREDEKSCLKDLLSELRQMLTVTYESQRGKAQLIFPEFFEESVENTPARLLEIRTHGCGHRYRYCFDKTKFQFHEYDELFPHVKAQETEEIVSRLALGRLQFPYELSKNARKEYEEYIKKHTKAAFNLLLSQRELDTLKWLLSQWTFQKEEVDEAIQMADNYQYVEALGYLMDYCHENYKIRKKKFEL